MYSEMARNIAGYAGISKNKAMRIARTEAHRIQCKATADAQWKAKEKGADVVKQWDASLDGKTRDTHRLLDGQIRELDEPFEVMGMTAMEPGGFGDPSEDCNCRCALLQRARWALGDEYTKWSPDTPVEISDDGTTQFIKVDANSFTEFKGYYKDITGQMTMNLEKDNKSLAKTGKSSKIKANLQYFAEKDIKNQESSSLKRAIKKYQKRIDEHNEKIKNPEKYIEDWQSLSSMKQEGLKRHWNKEIRNFNNSIDDRVAELKERGDFDE